MKPRVVGLILGLFSIVTILITVIAIVLVVMSGAVKERDRTALEELPPICRYKPCLAEGSSGCEETVPGDYHCSCNEGYGGKNCSVELTGCAEVTCRNGGFCVPWLIGEDNHQANCTCQAGFDGDRCEHSTTVSFSGGSHITVNSSRAEGYELKLRYGNRISPFLSANSQHTTFQYM